MIHGIKKNETPKQKENASPDPPAKRQNKKRKNTV